MKKTLLASAAVIAMSASGAFANDTLNTILATEEYAGATILETSSTIFGIKIEAVLADGTEVERKYRLDGTLRKEELSSDGVKTETTYADDGETVIKTEVESDDEDDDDEDDDEDDEDDDDEDDDEDDDDEDDEDDDESDDDEDDDDEVDDDDDEDDDEG